MSRYEGRVSVGWGKRSAVRSILNACGVEWHVVYRTRGIFAEDTYAFSGPEHKMRRARSALSSLGGL